MSILEHVLVLLAASVVVVALFRRLSLPPIIGYLFVGVLLGPSVMGVIDESANVHLIAEYGVVFLLFTIGLEFSLPQLVAMKWTVLGLGGAQVLVTAAVAGLAAWWLGASAAGAVVVGGALALSSTAVVTKQLTEQFEIHSRHGRRAVGVLLFQDVAVVPLLILIPILAAGRPEALPVELSWAMLKGAGVFVATILAGRWLLRPLFHEVARARSYELFTLAALFIALLAAWLTELAGLSLALGAFLAGITLGETEYRHQIEADIRPFRDVLLGLFFISIGMLVDIGVLARFWPLVLLGVALLMGFKTLLVTGLIWLRGGDTRVALRTGLVLCQGGEFGFAVLSLALRDNLIGPLTSQVVLAIILISMLLAPLLVRYNGFIAQWLTRTQEASFGRRAERDIAAESESLHDHVLLCGYGRTGQNVARFLEHEGVPYLALDLDPARVQEAKAAGDPVSFGDACRREILDAAGLARARMVVISFDDPAGALKVLERTRALRPELPVLLRTRDDSTLEAFQNAGATAVVPEILEASLMLASHTLALLDVPLTRVFRYVRDVRADRYRMLRGYFHGQERVDPSKVDRFREQLHAVTLPEQAYAIGRTLAELELEKVEVTVTAVRRGGIRGPQPEPDTVLQAGDVLVLYGAPENLESAEERLYSG